ncbi:hypothetical protein DPSP01_007542 [Paraphaeosphaeria sporulosa]|uniref:Alcohol dehydrogenase n=1 Tax=Paraphaeosphaeria sporulosa TaxID=1460663 RepID=A0A177C6T7_9PLEO|nr:alcohol dehydrogenase [Paraphaeosphaeria sporulosa]OAG02582.1 alcohol dehydrogenase [Paraphaeosphaeria sporulosa]
MRALIRTGDKSPETLTLDPNHPEPTPNDHPECYIIRTKACALTREELTWAEPKGPDAPVPGLDLAGEIISAPQSQGEHKFKPGDEVYALTTFTWKGNARDITVAHETELALKPEGLGWEETASVPLSALSAYQGLFVHGALKPPKEGKNTGKRVLITAASGGVGLWGVQLAHQAGADVVGTCGTSNVDFVKSLGVDTVLDYRKVDLLEWVSVDRAARGFDVVLDCIGGVTLTDAWKCAREGAKVVSVAEPPNPKRPEDGVAEGVLGVWFIVEPNGAQLAEVTDLLEQKKCQAVVDSVYELAQFEEAFKKLEEGHAKGKIILKVGA